MAKIFKLALEPKVFLTIETAGTCLTHVTLSPSNEGFVCQMERPIKSILDWLHAYADRREPPTHLHFAWEKLSPFTAAALKQLQTIPFGEVRSYGEMAHALHAPKAARAVGGACGRNPFPLFIPCHRIISGDGSLGGFSSPLSIKRELLKFEAG